MTTRSLTGGCQCDAIRYRLNGPLHDVVHCHCSMCRKAHGALFVSFGIANAADFAFEKGEDGLGEYISSPGAHRMFCRTCGGQAINTVDKWPDDVFIALGSLDVGQEPGHADGREHHIFWESRAAWYDTGDNLPKQARYGED